MKKTLALLTAILITATIFTACTNNNPTENPTNSETTTNNIQNVETTVKEEITTESNITEAITTDAPTENVTYVIEETKPVNNAQNTEPANTANTTNPANSNANNIDNIITKEEAKAAALNHAGLNASDVKRIEIELDRERNGLVYEIDFDAGKYEYEYEINAENGKVIRSAKEFRD